LISQERFNEIEVKHGCGYWNVCWEHACPCTIATENKGLRKSIYDYLVRESEEADYDFDHKPMVRCNSCGCLEYENDLVDGLCDLCCNN